MHHIYLDNQATTPLDPQVFLAMEPWFKEKFGNASSRNHSFGWEAEEAIEIARENVANLIGAMPKEIFFTSGATESNNLAIQGIVNVLEYKKPHVITVQTEHKAVLDICDHLEKNQYIITKLSVKKDGILDINKLKESIQSNTRLISVMHANNEIGVIQPIKKIGEICKKNKIIFHVDAAQSTGKIPIDINEMNIDLLSISGHKLYGPKGIGALYKRHGIKLHPIMHGGGHERGVRPGTLAVPNIVGLGKACQISKNIMSLENRKIAKLRNKLMQSIQNEIPNSTINGNMEKRLSGNLNMCFGNVDNEIIIASMPKIAISSGAACTSSKMEASHVLLALGLSKKAAFSSIRFGIGRFNTTEEIDEVSQQLIVSIKKLNTTSNYH